MLRKSTVLGLFIELEKWCIDHNEYYLILLVQREKSERNNFPSRSISQICIVKVVEVS